MKTTFINQNSENNIEKAGRKHLEGRAEDFEFYMEFEAPHSEDDVQGFLEELAQYTGDIDVAEKMIDQYKNLPPFNEFGLSFNYVTKDGEAEDFFCYQISWGGPSEEIRFFHNGRIEFVYLDWFCGIGFNITGEGYAQWLRDFFDEVEMMNWEGEREKNGYYEMIDEAFEEDEE